MLNFRYLLEMQVRLAVGQRSPEFRRDVWAGEINLGDDTIKMIFKALRMDGSPRE